MKESLKAISAIADEYELAEEQLRYWDRLGILTPRRVGAVRFYSDEDERKLQYIKRLMADGYRPSEIRNFLLASSWVDERSISQTKALHSLMKAAHRGQIIRQPFGLNVYNTVYRRVERAAKKNNRKAVLRTSSDGQALEAEVIE